MKGQDFYNDIKDLLERQWQQECGIDVDQLLKTAGGKAEITPDKGNELSEFFVDPTLFSLLRQYNESGDTMYRRMPPPQDTKKPQAKDVAPKRVLDEGDEQQPKKARQDRIRLFDHPDIPATTISKKFMDMATLLEHSPLRTIKKSYLLDIPPRIKQRLNYAHQSNNKQDDPTPTALLPLLDRTHDGELVFTFTIYQAHAPSKKLQEFHVLGSQTLTDLRDAIYCRMDFSAHGDRKDNQPDGEIINTFRQKRSPSYFYVDKTFYVDQRLHTTDTTASIRAWLNESTVLPMDALALRDLPLQLNTPYLFDHQQHCQHVLVARDIRLLESRDKRQADQYPIVSYSWRYRRYKCNMCMIYPAVYVTTNDYLSGYSPCFFCERCYEPFHFDKDGKPVTTFDVCAYHGT